MLIIAEGDNDERPAASEIRGGYFAFFEESPFAESHELSFDDFNLFVKEINIMSFHKQVRRRAHASHLTPLQTVFEFQIAYLCAIESYDQSLVLVTDEPKLTAPVFVCGSTDKVGAHHLHHTPL